MARQLIAMSVEYPAGNSDAVTRIRLIWRSDGAASSVFGRYWIDTEEVVACETPEQFERAITTYRELLCAG